MEPISSLFIYLECALKFQNNILIKFLPKINNICRYACLGTNYTCAYIVTITESQAELLHWTCCSDAAQHSIHT